MLRLLARRRGEVQNELGTGDEPARVARQTEPILGLQREPRRRQPDPGSDTKNPKASPNGPGATLSPFVPADLVHEITRNNETWMLTVGLFSDEASLTHVIWPRRVPSGVTIRLVGAITEPIERGWFVLEGLTPDSVKTMEPSYARLFAAHGLQDEPKESVKLQNARSAFRERHEGHGEWALNTMDFALRRITKRNPDLLLAYYQYYADHQLTDESHWYDHFTYDSDKNAGATAYGDTLINPSVLRLESKFPTDDPVSLLAGTLIHEFVHTPQGGGDNAASAAPKEAKAYAVELFFSERIGDKKRAAVIGNMSWNDSLSVSTGADTMFSDTYNTLKALYHVIDQGGAAADEARQMTVELISKNAEDYGPKLKGWMSNHR